jgi:hypothetical protein
MLLWSLKRSTMKLRMRNDKLDNLLGAFIVSLMAIVLLLVALIAASGNNCGSPNTIVTETTSTSVVVENNDNTNVVIEKPKKHIRVHYMIVGKSIIPYYSYDEK